MTRAELRTHALALRDGLVEWKGQLTPEQSMKAHAFLLELASYLEQPAALDDTPRKTPKERVQEADIT